MKRGKDYLELLFLLLVMSGCVYLLIFFIVHSNMAAKALAKIILGG